jgi:5-hydroxyisourate hydrolase
VSRITTHVLDTSLGRAAAALPVRLDSLESDGTWNTLSDRVTNAEGRVMDLLASGALEARTYRLTFDTRAYFAASGRPVFYPYVDVVFTIAAPTEHHHIPLLLSPFGYSTYRGT